MEYSGIFVLFALFKALFSTEIEPCQPKMNNQFALHQINNIFGFFLEKKKKKKKKTTFEVNVCFFCVEFDRYEEAMKMKRRTFH